MTVSGGRGTGADWHKKCHLRMRIAVVLLHWPITDRDTNNCRLI